MVRESNEILFKHSGASFKTDVRLTLVLMKRPVLLWFWSKMANTETDVEWCLPLQIFQIRYGLKKLNLFCILMLLCLILVNGDVVCVWCLLGEPTNQTQNPAFTINLFTLVIYTYTLVVTILKYELNDKLSWQYLRT